MRRLVLVAAVFLGGCLAGTGSFDWYDEAPRARAGRMPPPPPPSGEPVELRRRHHHGEAYRHAATTWFAAEGVNTGIRAFVITTSTVARTERGYVETEVVTESHAEGTSTALNPGPVAHTIVGARLTTVIDALNQRASEPELVRDPGADGVLAEVMRAAFGHLRVAFPADAVRPGDTWTGPVVHLDTRNVGGWVSVYIRPTFVLRRVDDGFAVIEWRGTIDSEPFCQLGPCVVGHGRIRGTSRISLADGYVGRTQLLIPVDIRGADAPQTGPAVLRFVARFDSTIRRD